jgi:hypothetical protein
MLGRIRSKLTYANVMATVAVFITLGGGAYAATTLKANSVGAAQLKNGAVTNKKLAKNAVTGAKVKDGSLLAADLAPGQLPAGPAGAKGDPGLKGDKGDKGDTGQTGPQGTALAYAYVKPHSAVAGGALDPARTKGFTAISRPFSGVYCLLPAAGVDPSLPVVVTPDRGPDTSAAVKMWAYPKTGAGLCVAASLPGRIEIDTFDEIGGGSTAAASDGVPFHIIVP